MVIEVFKQSQELSLQPAAVKLKEKGLIPPLTESSKHSCQPQPGPLNLNIEGWLPSLSVVFITHRIFVIRK